MIIWEVGGLGNLSGMGIGCGEAIAMMEVNGNVAWVRMSWQGVVWTKYCVIVD